MMASTSLPLIFTLAVTIFLPIFTTFSLPAELKGSPIQPAVVTRSLVDNDFENGAVNPWLDESIGNVKWRVENYSSPSENGFPAPPLASGSSYLRATRNADLSSGLAVLSSPVVTVNPGDSISFDFWIQSKLPQGNSLELVWLIGNTETILSDVTQFSKPDNQEWRSVTILIPIAAPSTGRFIFYGYCGTDEEDAIALDNISVNLIPVTTTTFRPGSPQSPPCNPCSANYSGTYGTISSPNYPLNYCNLLSCYYRIKVPQGYRIGLAFVDFVTEQYYDNVRIYDGPSAGNKSLGIFDGNNFTFPFYIQSSTNEMLVFFSTDSANNATGWTAKYGVY